MPDTTQIADSTNWLMNCGAPVFTIVAVIIAGYVLRVIPFYSNNLIPLAGLIVGAIVFPILNPHTALTAAFVTRSIIIGVALGYVATRFHDQIISGWEDKLTAKFPAANKVLTETNDNGTKTSFLSKPVDPATNPISAGASGKPDVGNPSPPPQL